MKFEQLCADWESSPSPLYPQLSWLSSPITKEGATGSDGPNGEKCWQFTPDTEPQWRVASVIYLSLPPFPLNPLRWLEWYEAYADRRVNTEETVRDLEQFGSVGVIYRRDEVIIVARW